MTRPRNVTDASFVEDVRKSAKPIIVDFWAEWCSPCRLVSPYPRPDPGNVRSGAKSGKAVLNQTVLELQFFGAQAAVAGHTVTRP